MWCYLVLLIIRIIVILEARLSVPELIPPVPSGINILNDQTACKGCRRVAIIEKSDNPHASGYQDQIDEWNRCMQNELGSYASLDADDSLVKQAMERCAGFSTPGIEYLAPSSFAGKLVEVLTSPCFHMRVGGNINPVYPDKIPEYLFRGSFDAGISGETDTQGREIKSRLTIELFYNGNPVELVKSWTTESTVATLSSQYNRMFDNSDALMRRDVPLDDLLNDFERRPTTCSIETGDKTELGPGEETEIKITDCKDEQGRNSRYFNRIIVEVLHGRIKDGSRILSDPTGDKIRAFRLDKLPVTFIYEAPEECDPSTEKISVYSTCQILDPGKEPMFITEPDKKIAEKEIKLVHPDLVAEYSSTIEEFSPDKDVDILITFKSDIKASYRLINVSVQKSEGTVTESYRQISSSLKSFSGNGRIFFQETSANCVKTARGTATASDAKIHQATKLIRIIYDAKTGEVRRVSLDNINVECRMDGQLEMVEKCSKPPGTHTSTSPWPLLHMPTTTQGMVADYPEFEKASGNRECGVITGGGERTFGIWRTRIDYTLKRAGND